MNTITDKQVEATLAVPEQNTKALALSGHDVNDLFGGDSIQIPLDAPLPVIEILREMPLFKMPDGNTAKTITGHIIHWHHANQYYESPFGSGEQGPPTCASSNGVKPDGGTALQCDMCAKCKWNAYGSAKNDDGTSSKGKACQNTIRLYVLLEGQIIPCVIKASPSSLGKKESLLKWLTNAPNVAMAASGSKKYQLIRVTFALHKKDFADSGFSASVLDLTTDKVLSPKNESDIPEIKALASLWKDFMDNYVGRIIQDVANEAQAVPSETPTDIGDDCPI